MAVRETRCKRHAQARVAGVNSMHLADHLVADVYGFDAPVPSLNAEFRSGGVASSNLASFSRMSPMELCPARLEVGPDRASLPRRDASRRTLLDHDDGE